MVLEIEQWVDSFSSMRVKVVNNPFTVIHYGQHFSHSFVHVVVYKRDSAIKLDTFLFYCIRHSLWLIYERNSTYANWNCGVFHYYWSFSVIGVIFPYKTVKFMHWMNIEQCETSIFQKISLETNVAIVHLATITKSFFLLVRVESTILTNHFIALSYVCLYIFLFCLSPVPKVMARHSPQNVCAYVLSSLLLFFF